MSEVEARWHPDDRRSMCVATVQWDQDASVITADITCPIQQEAETGLRRQIDASLHFEERGFVLMIGDLELVLSPNRELRHVELRSDREDWLMARLPQLPAFCPFGSLELLAAYDFNNRASVEADVVVVCDESYATVELQVGPEPNAGTWWRPARNVGVCCDASGRPARIRLEGFRLRSS